MTIFVRAIAATSLLFWLDATGAGAAVLDPAFNESLIATVPPGVTSMAWAPDGSGRLFLTRRSGEVLIVQDGQLKEAPFATVSPVFINATETGLLGLDFDQDFSSNGWLYVFVTVSATEQQIIRYRADGDIGAEPTIIVRELPTRGRNHNGGGIAVGPDGRLYWGVGDNGNGSGVNDDLTSLAAKVGRAERDGSVPEDNPFVDGDGPNADLIWARGVRNPFTLAWQPGADKLWVNVVGLRYEQVFVLGAGEHAGWNRYESIQPDGFVTPAISYPTNGPVPFTIVATGAVRSAGTATFTTQTAHRFHPGVRATIAGVGSDTFNGTAVIASVPSPTTFSFPQAGPDETSGGGTASGPDIGGCITGGAFLDSTSVPAPYRGNYFFGDFNSGRIERALVTASGSVSQVDHWADGINQPVDVSIGPDGDLYYVSLSGELYRARYRSSQGIVLSRRHLRIAEGGSVALGARLAAKPNVDVTVTVTRSGGDPDVTVEDALLVFTPADWASPQPVRLFASDDSDILDDAADLSFTAEGLAVETANVRVTDDDLVPVDGAAGAGGAGSGTGGDDSWSGAAGTGDGGVFVNGGNATTPGGSEGGATPGSEGGAPVVSHGGAAAGDGGVNAAPMATSNDDTGCGCRAVGASGGLSGLWAASALLALRLWRRKMS